MSKIITTPIKDLILIKPNVFEDSRGYFYESYNREIFNSLVSKQWDFVQDNESKSQKGVLRGLHFQNPPHAQGKLVRVVSGSVLDVAVDIRTKSKTFGQHYSVILSAENKLQFFVPPGFAHGFHVLEDNSVFSYKCTAYYNRDSEECLLWNDKDLNIDWKVDNPVLSEKDKNGLLFKNFHSSF